MSHSANYAKVAVLHAATIPYNTSYVQINISTTSVLHVDFCVLSLIKMVSDLQHTLDFAENIKCIFQVNVCTRICVI